MAALGLILLAAGSLAVTAEPCRVLVVAKQAGDPVFAEDAASAPCPARAGVGVLRYDARRKEAVARVALDPGAELGRAYLPERPAVGAGDPVRITASIGHVTVSREAVALQEARPGQRFFARLPDGSIMVAPAIGPAAGQEKQR